MRVFRLTKNSHWRFWYSSDVVIYRIVICRLKIWRELPNLDLDFPRPRDYPPAPGVGQMEISVTSEPTDLLWASTFVPCLRQCVRSAPELSDDFDLTHNFGSRLKARSSPKDYRLESGFVSGHHDWGLRTP